MPPYQTKQEQIAIEGVADLAIRSLLDRQQFFDPFGEADALGISSAAWPLFGLLWPSGMRLAERLALRPVDAAERVLEVGCGLGLASLVGHRRGADMTASDCHPLAAGFLLENLRLNGLLPMKYRHGHWGRLEGPQGCDAASVCLPVRGQFELIIGSDVLYERDAHGALAGFIALHAAAASEVWIVDPDRSNRSPFSKLMVAQGFMLSEERLDRDATPTEAAYKGRLLSYRRGRLPAGGVTGSP